MSVLQSNLKAVCKANFSEILPHCTFIESAMRQVVQKRQLRNIDKHLAAIGARIAVIEDEYVDRDYIEDYAKYYARCHKSYHRHCVRAHFFDKDFSIDTIKRLILSATDDSIGELDSHYLGFVVLRPLQKTVIGRTCLRSCGNRQDTSLLARKRVSVSFFGCPLHVECMPFQEQDRAVSACATSALWSAFQVTSTLFCHCTVSPSRITELATDLGISFGRTMPNNHGLTVEEMVHAVRRVGLDVVCVRLADPDMPLRRSIVLGNVYAYLHAGVPLVIVGKLLPNSPLTESSASMRDLHAVTACGYCEAGDVGLRTLQRPQLAAASIQDVIVNDDQVGVYTKMSASQSFGTVDFSTEWEKNGNKLGFKVRYLMIPVYHKIRVSYEEVWSALVGFDRMVRMYVRGVNIRWSIVLSRSNDYKRRVRSMSDISDEAKFSVLTSGLPRYIWEVSALLNEEESAIFCIDATDAGQGLEVGWSLFRGLDLVNIVGVMPFEEPIFDNPIFNACLEVAKRRITRAN